MARDWSERRTLALLEARIDEVAEGNVAEFPITCSKERQEDGTYLWAVTVHVRIPRVTEYDIEAFGTSYPDALRRAYLGLNNELKIRRQAHASNLQFGIAV